MSRQWLERKRCFYHVVATTKDGKQYSIGELPLTDDRKGTEKKKHPFMDGTDLEELGDGYASDKWNEILWGSLYFQSEDWYHTDRTDRNNKI